MAIDPFGKFAYVANQVSHNLSAYSIGENGALQPIPSSPFSAEMESVWLAVDPSGRFVYVMSRFSHNVSVFKIAEGGSLTPVAGSPFPAGTGPNSIAFSPHAKSSE